MKIAKQPIVTCKLCGSSLLEGDEFIQLKHSFKTDYFHYECWQAQNEVNEIAKDNDEFFAEIERL